MSFITQTNVLRRTLVLVFFILCMLGPWTFDLINVPAQYPCDVPFVRLYGDFCGYPLSGFETIKWAAGGFFSILSELIQGHFAARIPEFIFLICILVIALPFFSTLLLLGNRNSHRLQTMNVIAWALACLPALTMFLLQTNRDRFFHFFYLLWGVSIYILLAVVTILFEILALRLSIKPGMVRL